MCISWINKKCFDTVDARCKHEDDVQCNTEYGSIVLVVNDEHNRTIIVVLAKQEVAPC